MTDKVRGAITHQISPRLLTMRIAPQLWVKLHNQQQRLWLHGNRELGVEISGRRGFLVDRKGEPFHHRIAHKLLSSEGVRTTCRVAGPGGRGGAQPQLIRLGKDCPLRSALDEKGSTPGLLVLRQVCSPGQIKSCGQQLESFAVSSEQTSLA